MYIYIYIITFLMFFKYSIIEYYTKNAPKKKLVFF